MDRIKEAWELPQPVRSGMELRWKKMGIKDATAQRYQRLLAAQDGRCALCRREPRKIRLALDHNHKTGAVRGLLCGRCNYTLGIVEQFQSHIAGGLERLATYIKGEATLLPEDKRLDGPRPYIERRRRAVVSWLETYQSEHPDTPFPVVVELTAKKFGFCIRTVQRYLGM